MRPESLIYTLQQDDEHPKPFHIKWESPINPWCVPARLVYYALLGKILRKFKLEKYGKRQMFWQLASENDFRASILS